MTWVQIGSIGGATAALPSAALRSCRLTVVGSGIGAVPGRDYLAELPAIAAAASTGAFDVRPRVVPLREITALWDRPAPMNERLVFVP